MPAKVRIVLVEPREAGNVGAACRAMKNFGFRDLVIVGEHPPLQPLAGWWASGADDIVEGAKFAPSLQAALAGSHLTLATTSARGRSEAPSETPRSVAMLRSSLTEEQTLAIVFGREDRGLTAEEVSLCQRTATIPTSAALPTMNLAQSVALFCYELANAAEEGREPRSLADAALLERAHERLQALLLEAGFLDPVNPDRIYREIRSWVSRLELDEREAEVLLAIVRKLEWKIGRTPAK